MVSELLCEVTEEASDPSSRRPRPTAARDSGDRVYELDAAEIDDNERNVLDAAAYEYGHAEIERAHAEQAVLGAHGVLHEEMRQAEATLRASYGSAVIRLEMMLDGGTLTTRYVAAVCVGQYPDYKSVAGVGAELWDAVDDVRAQAAAVIGRAA